LADRDVVEAVVEDEDAKTDLLRVLDHVWWSPPARSLTQTRFRSRFMKLGVVTSRPARVIGIHFFNPVPVLQLVELVPSLLTSDDTTARSRS
jgi:3-hydroxybutyryl-CoA dehydrogenase